MSADLKMIEDALLLGEQAWHLSQRDVFAQAFSALDRVERRVKELEQKVEHRPEYVDRTAELEDALRQTIMIATWLSSASDYQKNGYAYLGWREREPVLERARKTLNGVS